jgi:ABC-type glycerol-3-phosphate transport system permease component
MIAQPALKPKRNIVLPSLSRGGTELLIHAILIGIGIIYIFPFVWTLGSALKTNAEFFSQGINPFPAGEWQWSNFANAWTRANFSQYMLNTLFVAFGAAILSIFLASITAYALSRLDIPGKNIIVGLIGIIFLLPQGYTIISTYELFGKFGLLTSLLPVVIIVSFGSIPLNAFFLYGFMRTIPAELEEAAVIDGASVWQRYLHLIIPMTRPMLGTLGLFMFLKGWNEFFLSLVFTLSDKSLRTLAVGMYTFVGINSRDWTLICAGAVISIIPVVILFIFLQRYFVEAFAGAVKQ